MGNAKLPGTVVINQNEVSQEIDLNELFDADVSSIPGFKQEFGQEMIDAMLERIGDGESIHGQKMRGYSEEYEESDDYKAANKDGTPNMTLTGDMLRAIDILSSGASSIKIGITDATEAAKAYNHNVGDTLPKREFFGLNTGEVREIVKQFQPRADQLVRESERVSEDPFRLQVLDLVRRLGQLGDDDEGLFSTEPFGL